MTNTISQVLTIFAVIAVACVVVATIGLTLLVKSIRSLRVPPEAGFFSTMRMIPFALVVLLDVLDLGLDVFAAPIAWIFLSRMGLPNLRNKAAIEALIPFSGPIPTFTLSWLAVRMFGLGDAATDQIDQAANVLGQPRRILPALDNLSAIPSARQSRPAIIDLDETEVSRYNSTG